MARWQQTGWEEDRRSWVYPQGVAREEDYKAWYDEEAYNRGYRKGFTDGHEAGFDKGAYSNYSQGADGTPYSVPAFLGSETASREGDAPEHSASKKKNREKQKKKQTLGKWQQWYDEVYENDRADLATFPLWYCWDDFVWVPFLGTVQETLRHELDADGSESPITIDVNMGQAWDYRVTVWSVASLGHLSGDTAETMLVLKNKFPRHAATLLSREVIVGWQENVVTHKKRLVKVNLGPTLLRLGN